MPVVITDCIGDCMVILHEAQGEAQVAFAVAVFAATLALFLLGTIAIVSAYRR